MTCPFCRCEIRSTEQIVVDPFFKNQESEEEIPAPRATTERTVSKNDDNESDYSAFEVLTMISSIMSLPVC